MRIAGRLLRARLAFGGACALLLAGCITEPVDDDTVYGHIDKPTGQRHKKIPQQPAGDSTPVEQPADAGPL